MPNDLPPGFEPVDDMPPGFEPAEDSPPGFEPVQGSGALSPEAMAHAASLPKNQGVQGDWGPLSLAVDALGWVGDKTRPLLNKAYEWTSKQPGYGGPVSELGSRTMLSSIWGDKLLEEMPDERRGPAVDSMERTLGEGGTTAALAGTQMVAQVPQMLIGLGWAKKGAKAAEAMKLEGKVLPKIVRLGSEAIGSGAENVLISGAQQAIKGEEQTPGTNFAFGAGMTALGGAAPLTVQSLKTAPKGSRAYRFGEAMEKAMKWDPLKAGLKKGRQIGAVVGNMIDHMADEIGFMRDELPQGHPKFLKGPTLKMDVELQSGGDGLVVTAYDQSGKRIGRTMFGKKEGGWEPASVVVEPEYRRQGVASQMYQHAETMTGQKVIPSGFQTPDGEALWKGNEKKGKFGAPPDQSGDARRAAEKNPMFGQQVRPGELEPSVILLHTDETGKVIASVNEFRADGTRKFYDVPLDSPENAMKIGKLRYERGIAIGAADDARMAMANLPEEIFDRVNYNPGRKFNSSDSSLKGTVESPRVRLKSLDQPSKPPGGQDSAVVVSEDGHIKLEPLEEPDFDVSDMPEVGAKIEILGRGGQRYSGTYHGMDPVTGKAVVNLGHDLDNLGTINEVSPHQVVKVAVADPPVPPPPEIPKKGDMPKAPKKGAYGFVRNPDGGYLVVQVLGPGEKPGTVNVTMGPTGRSIPMDASRVESRLPPGIESFDDLVPVQPTQNPDAAAHMTYEDLEEVEAARRMYEALSRKGAGLWERIQNQLLGGQVRGSKVMQFIHLRNQGSQAVLRAEGDYFKAVEAKLPKGPQRKAFNDDIGLIFEGKMKWEDLVKKYGDGVTDVAKKLSGNLMEKRTANDVRIAELGGIPDKLILERAEGLLDPYVARTYMVNLLPPGEWAKIVPKRHPEVFRRAVEYLVKDLSAGGNKHVLPEQVSAELETLLKAPNVVEALKSSGLKEARAFKKLLSRDPTIPKEIRDVMGEVTAGSVRIAATLGSQEAIIAKLELFQSIAADQNLSSIGRRADLHPEPVPEIPRLYGKLAGRYVKPEIYDELINLPGSIRNMYTFANQVANWVKGNQLMRIGPWWTSLMGNIQGGVYSGGLSFLRLYRYQKDFRASLRALRDYHNDPTGKTGDGWLVKEAKKVGADWSGRGEVEIASHSRKFINEMLKTLDAEPQGAFGLVTMTKKIAEKYQDVQGMFGNFLDTQDQTFRIAAYISLRRKFLAQKMSPEDAAINAASRIANSFPNPEHLGEAVKKLRSMVGIAAPYLTPKAEDLRIWSLLPKRLAQEPDLKYRLLGHAILFGGIARLMAHVSGVSNGSIAAAQESMTKRYQSYKPALVPLVSRDDLGRVQFIDTTNWFLPGSLMQGHPDDPLFKRVAYNVATYPFEGSLLQDAMDGMAAQGGIRRPVSQRPLLEGEGKTALLMDKLFKAGFGPGFVQQGMDVGRKTMVGGDYNQPVTLGPGTVGRNEEPFTPGQGVANMLGLKVSGAGERGFRAATMEAVGEMRSLSGSQLVQLWSSTRDMEEKQRITKAIIERIQLLGQQRNDAAALREAEALMMFLQNQ